jgi:PPOX class probable F420-dependent enzyme
MTALEELARRRVVVLTTYKRDGSGVDTKVHVAVVGDRAYVRSPGTAWKWKRLRRNPEARLDALPVHGRILDGDEARAAGRALARKYRFLHGLLIPAAHRLMRTPTIHMEFRA